MKHYEDYIARLHQIPRALSETTEVLRAGMKDNLMPVRFLLEKLPVQCQGIIDADPFLMPTKKYPAGISAEEQNRLTQQITTAIETDVIPAYRSFATFLRTEYAPHGRTALAVTSLPEGGKRAYARTKPLCRQCPIVFIETPHTLAISEMVSKPRSRSRSNRLFSP